MALDLLFFGPYALGSLIAHIELEKDLRILDNASHFRDCNSLIDDHIQNDCIAKVMAINPNFEECLSIKDNPTVCINQFAAYANNSDHCSIFTSETAYRYCMASIKANK